jgi:amino acid transporter
MQRVLWVRTSENPQVHFLVALENSLEQACENEWCLLQLSFVVVVVVVVVIIIIIIIIITVIVNHGNQALFTSELQFAFVGGEDREYLL